MLHLSHSPWFYGIIIIGEENKFVRFEVSTAVTMMFIIFWEMIIIKTNLVYKSFSPSEYIRFLDEYLNTPEPEGKRRLGRPRCRREDNIKMDLREIGWGGVVWTG
jgi:hypothetical protein